MRTIQASVPGASAGDHRCRCGLVLVASVGLFFLAETVSTAWGYDIYLQGQVGSIGMYGTTILDSMEVSSPSAQPAASWASGYHDGTVQTMYGPKTYGAEVSGSVDLRTGTLKAYLMATGFSEAKMHLIFRDKIYPYWEGGQTDPFTVTLKWNMYGDWYSNHPTKPANRGTYTTLFAEKNAELPYSLPLYQQYNLEDDIAEGAGHLDQEEQSLSFLFDPASDTYISLAANLSLWCQPSSEIKTWVADFSGTGTMEIELPPGAAFTSESGTLLVPEPATAWLLVPGLLAVLRSRRKRAV